MRELVQVVKTILGSHLKHKSTAGRRIARAYLKLYLSSLINKKGHRSIRLLGFVMNYGDYSTFYHLFKEVFVGQAYNELLPDEARILDVGANIGMTVLYFKFLYPNSTIQAFEPEPQNFRLLKKNITDNNLKGCSHYPIALGSQSGTLNMYVRKGESGDIGASLSKDLRGDFHASDELVQLPVKVERLSDYIKHNIDLMKIDIEGGEKDVFIDLVLSKKLERIRRIEMEFHLFLGNPLSDQLSHFENHKFSYSIVNWQTNVTNPLAGQCIIKANSSSVLGT